MSKIRLLFRHRSMELGGVEKVLLTIFRQLPPEEFEIHLLLNYAQGELLPQVPPYVQVHSLGKETTGLPRKILRRLRLYFHEKCPAVSYRLLGIPTPDREIVSIHYNFKEVLNSPFHQAKKIAWLHGDMRNTAMPKAYEAEMIRQLHRFDSTVWVSEFTLNAAQQAFKTRFENAQVIHNPIETEEILTKSKAYPADWNPDGGLKLVFVGRINRQKGIPELIQAALRLAQNGTSFQLVLLGEGELREELSKKVKDAGKEHQIRFLGYQDNPLPWVASADAYLLPSHSEAFPLGVAEALVLGTPVLSTQVGGIAEMMTSGVEGEFFEKGEQGILSVLEYITAERLSLYRKNIQARPEHFGTKEPMNKILQLLR